MPIGDYIKAYRNAKGLTQQEFADACGLSKGYISMLESGKNPRTGLPIAPSLDSLKRIAQAMGIGFDDLLQATDQGQVVSLNPDGGANITSGNSSFPGTFSYYPTKRIPILGRISAGVPLYAEQNIEGYTWVDMADGGEYFGLTVKGDSMDAAGIKEGYTLIVHRQNCVENGEVAVVLVNGFDATVKRFYRNENMVTLIPQSTNPVHMPQIYNAANTEIVIQGKVVEVKFKL